MGAVASAEERIRALRDRFVGGLTARIDGIEAELAQMAKDGSAMGLERLFHTLAGTAGTYVLDRIAELAAQGEEICDDQIVDASAMRALHVIAADLRAALAAEGPAPALKLVPPEEEAEADATRTDGLTGLLTHSAFERQLESAV